MERVMPDSVRLVKFYRDETPLFSRYQIEHQIETAFSRNVPLSSGGAVVIDATEALVAIDVNSGKATSGADIEETALATNLEAADEIARQLKLRDIGGLVVIDFIDMEHPKHMREVETRLREALKYDRARVQIGRISRLGLLELSRQRLQRSLGETSYVTCPRCQGVGHIRSIESMAFHVLRVVHEEMVRPHCGGVIAQLPVEVATFLLNEKRSEVEKLEKRYAARIMLVPNPHLEVPDYKIQKIRREEQYPAKASYHLVEPVEPTLPSSKDRYSATSTEAVVRTVSFPHQSTPEPEAKPASLYGWLVRFASWLAGINESREEMQAPPPALEDRPEEKQPLIEQTQPEHKGPDKEVLFDGRVTERVEKKKKRPRKRNKTGVRPALQSEEALSAEGQHALELPSSEENPALPETTAVAPSIAPDADAQAKAVDFKPMPDFRSTPDVAVEPLLSLPLLPAAEPTHENRLEQVETHLDQSMPQSAPVEKTHTPHRKRRFPKKRTTSTDEERLTQVETEQDQHNENEETPPLRQDAPQPESVRSDS
jgi:ribonuclease E